MFLLLIVAIAIGLLNKQPKRYWLHGAYAIGVQIVMGVLFSGRGTLEDPTGDGLLMAPIRQATNDGPMMGLVSLVVIVVLWGVPIWLLVRGYQKKASD